MVELTDGDHSENADGLEFVFTKTCLKQNFFGCILDQLSELTQNSKRTKVVFNDNCVEENLDSEEEV